MSKRPKQLLTTTALLEGTLALVLLARPGVVLLLLLGVEQGSTEAYFLSRIAGAALLSASVAWWRGRADAPGAAFRGLLWGAMVYNAAATVLLALAPTLWRMNGIGLWPAVAVHAVMSGWCIACVLPREAAGDGGEPTAC
jgi:hypothetical protein